MKTFLKMQALSTLFAIPFLALYALALWIGYLIDGEDGLLSFALLLVVFRALDAGEDIAYGRESSSDARRRYRSRGY